MCKDKLVRYLAIKYVVVKWKKQDGAVKTKQEIKDKFSADNTVADLWMDYSKLMLLHFRMSGRIRHIYQIEMVYHNYYSHIHIRLHIESSDENIYLSVNSVVEIT